MGTFSDQTAVVTGATSGIGRAIALSLAACGASLFLVGRKKEILAEVAAKARESGRAVSSFQTDLTRDDEIERLKKDLLSRAENVDLLIHSAGIFHMAHFEDASVQDFDEQYRVNVRAPFLLTQALLPKLRWSCGQVVFINSSVGLTSRGQISQYAATKHALKGLADSLRDEVNSAGIRVLSVYPGRTATPQQEAICKMEGKAYQPELMMQPEDVAVAVLNALLLARTAEITNLSIRPMKRV
jgi:short-subunit dehydrogenase